MLRDWSTLWTHHQHGSSLEGIMAFTVIQACVLLNVCAMMMHMQNNMWMFLNLQNFGRKVEKNRSKD